MLFHQRQTRWMALILAAALSTAVLAGCSPATSGTSVTTNSPTGSTTAKTSSATTATTGQPGTTATVINAVQSITVDYDADDLDASTNGTASAVIALNGNSILVTGIGAIVSSCKVTISAAGTYQISGTLNDAGRASFVSTTSISLQYDVFKAMRCP